MYADLYTTKTAHAVHLNASYLHACAHLCMLEFLCKEVGQADNCVQRLAVWLTAIVEKAGFHATGRQGQGQTSLSLLVDFLDSP